jgi:hypothetical protein
MGDHQLDHTKAFAVARRSYGLLEVVRCKVGTFFRVILLSWLSHHFAARAAVVGLDVDPVRRSFACVAGHVQVVSAWVYAKVAETTTQ